VLEKHDEGSKISCRRLEVVLHWGSRVPQWLNQPTRQRLLSVLGESLICALLWGSILFVTDDRWVGSILWDGIRAGVLWGVLAFYSRTQYYKIMKRENSKENGKIFKDDTA